MSGIHKNAEKNRGTVTHRRSTSRQQKILTAISEAIETRGYPPSMRESEISLVLLRSSVTHQLNRLEELGQYQVSKRPRKLLNLK